MKAKHNRMIDEYVKKHYGDLERGVLAPEVKYKVLWKIYRKKYKEKRVQVKMLRNLLKGREEIESWAPSPDKVLPKEDGFNHLAEGFKEFFDLHENKENSYLDWLHDDITWCRRECSNMDCERNSRNRRCKTGLHSVADMFDPFKCPVDAELPK